MKGEECREEAKTMRRWPPRVRKSGDGVDTNLVGANLRVSRQGYPRGWVYLGGY